MKKTVAPGKTPRTFDPDALFAKAVRYAEKMIKCDSKDWDYALWSGLTLEHLCRACLANVHPALLADTGDKSWSHLFYSLGFSPVEPKFLAKSIATAEVIKRLEKIFPDFSHELSDFCLTHTGKRNSELHSGDGPFEGVPASSWQPRFFETCTVLSKLLGLSLPDLIGNEQAAFATKVIEAAADKAAEAVKGEVEAHKKVWTAKSPEDKKRLQSAAEVWATRQAGHRVSCPACGSPSLLNGEPTGPAIMSFERDLIKEMTEFLPNRFECVACGLKIAGLSKLRIVGLGETFKHTNLYDPAELYAPEDRYPDFGEDNNEP